MVLRAVCVVLLFSILVIAGCGTVANLACTPYEEGGKSPFGGVRQDECWMKKAVNGGAGCSKHPEAGSEQHPQVARTLIYAADLPFSFVGDLVTWPYTAAYTWINQPVPVPPIVQATATSPTQGNLATANNEPDKKAKELDADERKGKDKEPDQLPMVLPKPKTANP